MGFLSRLLGLKSSEDYCIDIMETAEHLNPERIKIMADYLEEMYKLKTIEFARARNQKPIPAEHDPPGLR